MSVPGARPSDQSFGTLAPSPAPPPASPPAPPPLPFPAQSELEAPPEAAVPALPTAAQQGGANTAFQRYRFYLNNFYEYHRRGLTWRYLQRGQEPWFHPNKALVNFDQVEPPAPEDWYQVYSNPFGTRDLDQMHDMQARNVQMMRADKNSGPRVASRDDSAKWVRDQLILRNLEVRALRHLGAGGEGLATLFDIRSRTTGVRKRFVIKRSYTQGGLREEKRQQLSLRRAPHIVRALKLGEDLVTDVAADDRMHQVFENDDSDPDILLQEYMKRGDLEGLVVKAVAAGENIPNSILWKAFFCLVRACLAMEYPPRRQVQEDGSEVWAPETGEDGVERIPIIESEIVGYGLVHFDLDPKNVLIGDFDDNHLAAPAYKVTDFGCARVVKSPEFNTREAHWAHRRVGKLPFFMPEQFHKEWEYVAELPQDENPIPKVAGNYGPASNIWAVGMILYCMVTRREPPYPPFATGPMNGPDGSLMPDGIPALRDIDGNVVESFYTHGGWLRDQMNIDNDLKGLLIRCLADQPAHRPTLQELSTYMARAERMQGWNDDPDDRDWFDRMAGEPADPNAIIDPALALPDRNLGRVLGTQAVSMWNLLTRQAGLDLGQAQRYISTFMPDVVLRLATAAGAGLEAFLGAWGSASSPAPPSFPQGVGNDLAGGQVPDNMAHLFTAQMAEIVMNSAGIDSVNPSPAASRQRASSRRAADPLPLARQMRASNTDQENNLMSGVNQRLLRGGTSSTNLRPDGSRDVNIGSKISTGDNSPNIFLGAHDPTSAGNSGGNGRSVRRIVLPLPLVRGSRVFNTISIPTYARGADPPPAPPGYLYGRTSSVEGYTVPEGLSALRVDPVDPAEGGVPNVFYREIALGIAVPQSSNALIQSQRPSQATGDGRASRAPLVRAVRIPPYSPFARPPSRPEGYHYGRRLYLSPAELQILADRGIRAPPGRMVIRLVHVEPSDDNVERPTIFYQIEPWPSQAPPAPTQDDPEPNILYATLPILTTDARADS